MEDRLWLEKNIGKDLNMDVRTCIGLNWLMTQTNDLSFDFLRNRVPAELLKRNAKGNAAQ
jgi:hypothetical protein